MRIGVFGGTFDPIHFGHLHVATKTRDLFDLDQIHFTVSLVPPHKAEKSLTSPYHRYAMCVLATEREAVFRASTIELEDPLHPYTVNTLEKFSRIYRDRVAIFFIAGADSFAEINKWVEYERLLLNYNFIFVERPGIEVSGFQFLRLPEILGRVADMRRASPEELRREVARRLDSGAKGIYLVDIGALDISSTIVREKLRRGEDASALLPGPVLSYALKYSVYAKRDNA